jgi:hypothetical protein
MAKPTAAEPVLVTNSDGTTTQFVVTRGALEILDQLCSALGKLGARVDRAGVLNMLTAYFKIEQSDRARKLGNLLDTPERLVPFMCAYNIELPASESTGAPSQVQAVLPAINVLPGIIDEINRLTAPTLLLDHSGRIIALNHRATLRFDRRIIGGYCAFWFQLPPDIVRVLSDGGTFARAESFQATTIQRSGKQTYRVRIAPFQTRYHTLMFFG